MATTSKQAAVKLADANEAIHQIAVDLRMALKDGDTSRYRMNGMSIPSVIGQIDAAQRAISSIQDLMKKVDITTKR